MSKDTSAFHVSERFGIRDGHRFFRCGSGPRAGQWAVADYSGGWPWTTDDGVLWVKPGQEIALFKDTIALHLEGPDGDTKTVMSATEAVIVATMLDFPLKVNGDLYRVAKVQEGTDTGARLDLGVEPMSGYAVPRVEGEGFSFDGARLTEAMQPGLGRALARLIPHYLADHPLMFQQEEGEMNWLQVLAGHLAKSFGVRR